MERLKTVTSAPAALAPVTGSVDLLIELARSDMAGVDALIVQRMQSPVAVIPALADHLIAAGGKRLRPLLTVAADRLAGGAGEKLSETRRRGRVHPYRHPAA